MYGREQTFLPVGVADRIARKVIDQFFSKGKTVGVDGFVYEPRVKIKHQNKKVGEVLNNLRKRGKYCITNEKHYLSNTKYVRKTLLHDLEDRSAVISSIDAYWKELEAEGVQVRIYSIVGREIRFYLASTETQKENQNRIQLYNDIISFIRAEIVKEAKAAKDAKKKADEKREKEYKEYVAQVAKQMKEEALKRKRGAKEAEKAALDVINTLLKTPEQKKAAKKLLEAITSNNFSAVLAALQKELSSVESKTEKSVK